MRSSLHGVLLAAGPSFTPCYINHRFFESGWQARLDAEPGWVRYPDDIGTCVATRVGHGAHTAATAAGNAGSPAVTPVLAGSNTTVTLGNMAGAVSRRLIHMRAC